MSGDREIPAEAGVQAATGESGASATPSFGLPEGAASGMPGPPQPLDIGPSTFVWGERTYVMGILNVTPDSFSGDGLLASDDPVAAALAQARAMASEGADILDVGGESTRPGHEIVGVEDEIRRVVPVIKAIRDALPAMPISVDTTKPAVAEAALNAGAHLVNDVWGVAEDDALSVLAAAHGIPIMLMHNRAEARYTNLIAEILADLQAAVDRALRAGVLWDSIVVDPGFGFGKTPEHNLELMRHLDAIRLLGRPVLLGTSRKSTLGKVLDLPADQRVEATLTTTALAAAAGVDIVRVHDVRENVRAARMADAIVRGDNRTTAEGAGS
ncbi:MAG TPA: dihydropteroate synthase [Candidatus Limnocylindrales bacterium]|nr:dihydropteroate synthase [Candidatus Limnocylindrales bacterium]